MAKEIVLVTGPVGVAAEPNNSQKYCHHRKANTERFLYRNIFKPIKILFLPKGKTSSFTFVIFTLGFFLIILTMLLCF